jgi:subtilase family serine protease
MFRVTKSTLLIATTAGLASLFAMVPALGVIGAANAASSVPASVAVPGSQPAVPSSSPNLGAVPATTSISFEVTLSPQNAAGVAALDQEVSNPASPSYRHYLTAAQWEAEFSPTAAQVSEVTSWLASQGLAVGTVSPDRLSVAVSGSAAQIDHAFSTSLNNYSVSGRSVRMASSAISVPSTLAGLVQATPGLDQTVATPSNVGNGSDQASAATTTGNGSVSSSSPIPQPPGFRNAGPCSSYYGQKIDTTDPSYGAGYAAHLPYAVCGYTPEQMESAYGLSAGIAKGVDGKGVTVAIVDAYESPTLLSDAEKYYYFNDSADPLPASQFSTHISPTFDDENLCGASGWSGEQTLDVEAVHATAPGAHILYVGAKDCVNGLLDSERQVVDGGLANVISNSWGDDAGDLLDSSSDRAANDTVFEMAIATGISVLFSAGDSGDEFSSTGLTTPDYPPSSPYVTAVGGTSLQVGSTGARIGELGWSTGKSTLCTTAVVGAVTGCTKRTLGKYLPPDPGGYDYGGGGGTSYQYAQPYYQVGVVPAALSERNATSGSTPARVEPDISMDADPTTGYLVGETQNFGSSVAYGQYRIGGTSLASPLLAGVVATADQVSGISVGFINPTVYKLHSTSPGVIFDVVPGGNQALVRNDFLNDLDASDGILTSIRSETYEGVEEYCDATGSCASRDVALTTTKGFDSMTGLGTPNAGFVLALAKG